jgi:hypothetical protein
MKVDENRERGTLKSEGREPRTISASRSGAGGLCAWRSIAAVNHPDAGRAWQEIKPGSSMVDTMQVAERRLDRPRCRANTVALGEYLWIRISETEHPSSDNPMQVPW